MDDWERSSRSSSSTRSAAIFPVTPPVPADQGVRGAGSVIDEEWERKGRDDGAKNVERMIFYHLPVSRYK